jgi:hypothetical protein
MAKQRTENLELILHDQDENSFHADYLENINKVDEGDKDRQAAELELRADLDDNTEAITDEVTVRVAGDATRWSRLRQSRPPLSRPIDQRTGRPFVAPQLPTHANSLSVKRFPQRRVRGEGRRQMRPCPA